MGGGDLYRVWLPILARLNFPPTIQAKLKVQATEFAKSSKTEGGRDVRNGLSP
ncbi:hypothetical protein ACIO51_05525 [Providencia stuartii]